MTNDDKSQKRFWDLFFDKEKYEEYKRKYRIDEKRAESRYGKVNPALRCPHCNTTGQVRAKQVERRQGIDGNKAAVGVLTAGLSLLVTGLAKEGKVYQLRCDNCELVWDVQSGREFF